MNLQRNAQSTPIRQAFSAIFYVALASIGASAAHAQGGSPVKPVATASSVSAETVASGLANPWAVAFLPDGSFLVTERAGRLRVIQANGQVGPPVAGLPPIAAGGQGGLLDVVTDTDFENNRRIYFCFSEPAADRGSGNSTALASATLVRGVPVLQNVKVIFSQKPKVDSNLHFGCRIVQDRQGDLFFTLGDRYHRKDDAQILGNHLGKVVHIRPDGTPAPGNPVTDTAGALPEIWSWGHRNIQGATLGPDGRLWTHEHGPQGGDEINVAHAGRNYGWPVITYGENYGGGKIGEGTQKRGLEPPLHYWVPSIAPSGMAFLTSDRYGPQWRGSLFVGSLKFARLHRLEIRDGKVARDEFLLDAGEGRIRDVRQGPDGWLYLLTDSPQGKLLRLKP